MTNQRASRAGIGLKSNILVAQQAIDLSNPNHYASIIKRVCNCSAPSFTCVVSRKEIEARSFT